MVRAGEAQKVMLPESELPEMMLMSRPRPGTRHKMKATPRLPGFVGQKLNARSADRWPTCVCRHFGKYMPGSGRSQDR